MQSARVRVHAGSRNRVPGTTGAVVERHGQEDPWICKQLDQLDQLDPLDQFDFEPNF